MSFVPHPPIFLSEIRVNDIWLLLCIGTIWELVCRLYILYVKIKPNWLQQKEINLKLLQVETNAKRRLGPSAFVETSKLERRVLSQEKELEQIYTKRKLQGDKVEKILLRYGNMILAFIIFFFYYGVPILTVESGAPIPDTIGEYEHSVPFTKRMLFPLSYVGIGIKISKWGIEQADSSVGALLVMWSAQVTVGKLMDCLDAYYL